nr:hypothetical protein [Micromonospora sp. DSM 115978]
MSTLAVRPDTPPPTPAAESVVSLAASAAAILALHTADEQGMCTQCRAAYAHLTPHPCSQHAWAQRVNQSVPTPQTLHLLGLPCP